MEKPRKRSNKLIIYTLLPLNIAIIYFFLFPITSFAKNLSFSPYSNTCVKQESLLFNHHYKNNPSNFYKHYIKISLLLDPVYQSMNLNSESQSDYMISENRNKGRLYGDTSSENTKMVLGFGGIYATSGKDLPNNFNVYISRIKTFAYSKSQHRWLVIDNQPYPCGIYIFTLPWGNSKVSKCQKITYTNSYVKISLTANELQNSCLHFWGKSVPIHKDDYLYYACAYTFWVDTPAIGKLTATNGIDAKDATGDNTIVQLYSSRGLSSSYYPKTHWGHTIPNSEYFNCNGSSLNYLYLMNY